jgi:glycosyltransferase involved in cell wall biosynthesis
MRILHYVNYQRGGITRYAEEILRAMPTGIESHLVCPPGTVLDALRCVVHPTLIDLQPNRPWSESLGFLRSQFENPLRMLRVLKQVRPDLIHFGNVNHLSYPYWGRRLKSLGIPFVVSVHDVRREKAIINRCWEDRQLRAIYRDAAALFVHGPTQQAQLVEFAGVVEGKVQVVPHGIYNYPDPLVPVDVRADLQIPPGARVGLFFGGVRDDKGLDLLIAAVATLPDTHLIVVGRSTSKQNRPVSYYRDLARSLHVQSRIHFVESYVPDVRVPDYFHAADWCGLAYGRGFSSQSGVLCSAVHFRTPVVVTVAPTLVEIVRRFQIGVVAESASVEALAAAIASLNAALGGGSSASFEQFERECSWQGNADITATTYRSILEARKKSEN